MYERIIDCFLLNCGAISHFNGWGARIRTYEMSESESDALPLGDTPISPILALFLPFVKVKTTKNTTFY